MNPQADLHIHTNFSDSTFSPAQVVAEGLKAGLACLAVTDHDTMDGVPPAREAALGTNLEIVPGIELSSTIENKDVHILGYFLQENDPTLRKQLEEIRSIRRERVRLMVDKLKDLGIGRIEPQEVFALAKEGSVGRPHLARILQEKGVVGSTREAFDRFLAEGRPAYVQKFQLDPYQAIKLIRQAHGVAVLAHPMVTQKDELIAGFVEAGLKGLETHYPNCPNTTVEFYEKLAKKYDLVCTGGSDAHGDNRSTTYIGKKTVGIEVVEQLRALRGQ